MNIRNKMNMQSQKQMDDKMKSYLHSFLAWCYHQNHHFFETLTDDELVNYFLTSLKHDPWFKIYFTNDSLANTAYIYDFISTFKNESSMLEYKEDIRPIKDGPYREVNKANA